MGRAKRATVRGYGGQACQKVPHCQFLVKKHGIQVRSGQIFSSIRSFLGQFQVILRSFLVRSRK